MNKYEVLGVVGEGAYGVVLKCRNKENQHIVAIKKFKETEDNNEIVKKSIQREVKMLRLLKHPNIVQLIEAFKRKGRIYLVFEYVDKNLLEVLEVTPTGLEPHYIRKTIFQLLKSIDFCHQHDVVHRDIKPENLLMAPDGHLKLCDFGFARTLASAAQEPLTDYVATRWYRAPELLLSQQVYGKGVDIWAIGCLLCELTDGNPLFPGENEVDQLYLIQKVLGPLTSEQQECFSKNPRFLGMKFPELGKPETIERKYLGKLPRKAIGFVKGLLKMEPSERLTTREAMKHPYFEELPEAQEYLKQLESGVIPERKETSQTIQPQHVIKGQLSAPSHSQTPNMQINLIRQSKNFLGMSKVPNFLSSQVLSQQNTAYSYKISEQQSNENKSVEKAKEGKKPTSIDKMPQTVYNGFGEAKMVGQHCFPSIKQQQLNQQMQQTKNFKTISGQGQVKALGQQGSQNQIKISNLNIIYNQNTYNYQKHSSQGQKPRQLVKKK